jgi:hypothetical protein
LFILGIILITPGGTIPAFLDGTTGIPAESTLDTGKPLAAV